jgi:hypothetical protein
MMLSDTRPTGRRPSRGAAVAMAAAALIAWAAAPAAAQGSFSRLSDAQLRARGFRSAARSAELELFANEKTGFLAVRTLADGALRYSSPLDWEDDGIASGFVRNSLPSLLSIRAKDRNSQQYPINSYVNSVQRSGLSLEPIASGVRLVHYFRREGITIPVDVTVEGSELVLSVPLGEIEEEGDEMSLSLLSFTLAPYFGAAGRSERGYIFVPDGSGAIIRFSNRNSSAVYQQYVYGRDPAFAPVMRRSVSETASLPVFGISAEDRGFFAIIEEGAARALIGAEAAYQRTGYNAASASCIVRDFDNVTVRERTGTPRDIPIFEKGNFARERFSVRYIFLSGKDNGYVGMAQAYRRYLQDRGRFTKARDASEPALFLDFLGAGPKVKPVAGIPMKTTVAYTSFASARSAIEELRARKVDSFVVKYEGWTAGGMMGRYPSTPKAEASLGGERGFRRLAEWLGSSGIPFFPTVDFVNLYEPDLGHLVELAANRAVNHAPARIQEHRLSTFDAWADSEVSWTLRAPVVKKNVERFAAMWEGKAAGSGIAPDSLGNLPCSDFGLNGDGTSRVAAAATLESLLGKLDGRGMALSRPCDYALGRADYVFDLPTGSSRFDVEDEAVPFYQILLRGYVPFSNLPGNRDLGKEKYELALLETGACPSYLWAASNADDVRDTRLEYFMNVAAEDWIDEAAELYAEVAPLLRKISGKAIVAHEIMGDGLRRTTFEGGFQIVVNYSGRAARTDDGREVAPLSYVAGYAAGSGEGR